MSEHPHPLSDTIYYINHPNKYRKIVMNRRRHEAHHFHQPVKGVETGAIACIGCKTYFFCSLSIEETLKNI